MKMTRQLFSLVKKFKNNQIQGYHEEDCWCTYVAFGFGFWFILFFVCARYRQPLIPLMIPYAVMAIVELCTLFKKRDFRNSILMLFFLAVLMLETNHNLLGLSPNRVKAEDHVMLGTAYLEQQDMRKARIEYEKAISADATYAEGFNNLGMLLARLGNLYEAELNFNNALRADTMLVETYMNLATVYGMALIIVALIEALIYTALCSREEQRLEEKEG